MSMSVCVSVSKHNNQILYQFFTNFFVRVSYGHISVLLWLRCDTWCIYAFTDDVMLFRDGSYGTAVPVGSELNVTHQGPSRILHHSVYNFWKKTFGLIGTVLYRLNANTIAKATVFEYWKEVYMLHIYQYRVLNVLHQGWDAFYDDFLYLNVLYCC